MRVLKLDALTIHRLRTAHNEAAEVLRVIRQNRLTDTALSDMHLLEAAVQTLEVLLCGVEKEERNR